MGGVSLECVRPPLGAWQPLAVVQHVHIQFICVLGLPVLWHSGLASRLPYAWRPERVLEGERNLGMQPPNPNSKASKLLLWTYYTGNIVQFPNPLSHLTSI